MNHLYYNCINYMLLHHSPSITQMDTFVIALPYIIHGLDNVA